MGNLTYTTQQVQDLLDKVKNGESIQGTYAQIKALKNAGKLQPGNVYQIEDYNATSKQSDTVVVPKIAFSIILTAVSSDFFSEEAFALAKNMRNELRKIYYCIENDTSRFAWADATNGKGVIYRMIDNNGNDVPYDFENIRFIRTLALPTNDSPIRQLAGQFVGIDGVSLPGLTTINQKNNFPTFGNGVYRNNVIKPYFKDGVQYLNNIICSGNKWSNNSFDDNCHDITILYGSVNEGCNTFGKNCYGIAMTQADSNIFGDDFHENSIDGYIYNNSFGIGCTQNIFGDHVNCNSFGNFFIGGVVGNMVAFNAFGENCLNINIVSSAYNAFGNGCSDISMGGHSYNNTFGNGCQHVLFGVNQGAYGWQPLEYVSNVKISDGVSYIRLTKTDSAQNTADSYTDNVNIHRGVHGGLKSKDNNGNITYTVDEEHPILDILIDVFSQDYEINIAFDKDGNLVQWTA